MTLPLAFPFGEGIFVVQNKNLRIWKKCNKFCKKICNFSTHVIYYLRVMRNNPKIQHNRRKWHA